MCPVSTCSFLAFTIKTETKMTLACIVSTKISCIVNFLEIEMVTFVNYTHIYLMEYGFENDSIKNTSFSMCDRGLSEQNCKGDR